MVTNEKNKKICTIYTGIFHLEMIILPYIAQKINQDENVVIMNEDNLEESANIVLNKMVTNGKIKKELKKINWNNNDFEKFKNIKQSLEKGKKLNIIIEGKENYIENVNRNIENWIEKNKNVNIIYCYELSDNSGNITDKMKKYKYLLNTKGIMEINK